MAGPRNGPQPELRMAYEWQTVEQAAVSLGISVRTIARRVAQGKLQTRMEAGRREVFICTDEQPAPEAVQAAAVPEQPPRYASFAEATVQQPDASAAGSSGQYREEDALKEAFLVLAEDRAHRAEITLTVFHQSVTLATTEAHRARLNSRIAWGTVGAMALAIVIAVGWTCSRVTTSRMQVDRLSDKVHDLSTLNAEATRQRDDEAAERAQVQQALAQTSVEKARMEGRLAEFQSRADLSAAQLRDIQEQLRQAQEKLASAPPSTQASSFAEKIAGIMLGN